MLLYSIRICWVQCTFIYLTDSFPTADFDFTGLFNFYTSFFSLYSRHASQQCLSICPSNSCHMIPCSTYIIPNISKPTRMSKPAYLENYFKNNTFESVLMRWMKVEPIIQSEVSQKEKHQYSTLTHIYGI